MSDQAFDVLILIARPAAGKSEIIHYLKQAAPADRLERFHIGQMDEIDDFPMIWAWFEEDRLLAEMGKPRLHTHPNGDFLWDYLWDLLIRRIGLEYHKRQRDASAASTVTTLVEFARGRQHGGFRDAFQHLPADLLEHAAVLYVNVSYTESLRKNRKRYNPARPDSILEHALSDEKMETIYRESDWEELSGGRPDGYLECQGARVPFVVFENEDDVTTPGGEPLGRRLEACLASLWNLYRGR